MTSIRRRRWTGFACGCVLIVASCTDDAGETTDDTAVVTDASAEDRESSDGAVSRDTTEIVSRDSVVADDRSEDGGVVGYDMNDLPDGLSECRSTEPLAGDWCVLSGEVSEGGSVRIEGPLSPLSLVPEDGAYVTAVPLGTVEQPTISVTTLDATGEVTGEEELTIGRADRSGDFTIAGEVRTQTDDEFALGERVAGAEVTIAGQTVTTDEIGNFEIGTLPADADLIHVAADGYIGRLDSIIFLIANDQTGLGNSFRTPEQARVVIELQSLADPVPVDRGDSSVQLNDEVRLVFGADGAPVATDVSLTEAPSIGTALFGAPAAFDISPVELGPGGAVHIALPDDVLDDVELPDQIEAQLWEPTTMTKRSVVAEIDDDAGELVLPVEEIRGETQWIIPELFRIRTTPGGPADPDHDTVREFVPAGVRGCGSPDDAYTITHTFDYYPETSQDPGQAGAVNVTLNMKLISFGVNIGEFIRSYEGVGEVQRLTATVRVPEGKQLRQPAYIKVDLDEVVTRIEASRLGMAVLGNPFMGIEDEFAVLWTSRSVEAVAANFVTRGGDGLAAEDFDDYEETDPDDCGGLAGTWQTTDRGLSLLAGGEEVVTTITIANLGDDSYRLTATFPCGHEMRRTLERVDDDEGDLSPWYRETERLDESADCDYTDCGYVSAPADVGRQWRINGVGDLVFYGPERCYALVGMTWRRVD